MKLFAEFMKVERLDDGTVRVSGIASSEAVDSQGEIVKADAMRDALPDFMSLGTGALRSMHQSIAAGIVTKAEVRDDNKTYIEAEVVDPVEALKVEKGVYKGFSIGGKVTKREGKVIEKIRLGEISLVDRGANPEALLSLMKADIEGDAMEQDIKKGMWSVSQFAEMLQAVANMAANADSESDLEGDNSAVPDKLKTWLGLGIDVFREMAEEETAELLESLKDPAALPEPAVLELAEPAGDLGKVGVEKAEPFAKVGARNSKADAEAIQAIHDAANDIMKKAMSLGAAMPGAAKADPAGDLAKLDAEKTEALAKVETLEKALVEAKAESETLAKRVQELEAQPEPPKAAVADLPGVAINKAQDAGAEDPREAALRKAVESNDPHEMTKFILKYGGKPMA